MLAERLQVVIIERNLQSRSGLMIPFRAFLGVQFNADTETQAVRVEHVTEVQQTMALQDSASMRNTQQDCSLFDTAHERKILPSLLSSNPIRPILGFTSV